MAFECSRPARDRAALTEDMAEPAVPKCAERAPLEAKTGRTGSSSFTFHNRLMAVRLDASRACARVARRGTVSCLGRVITDKDIVVEC